ncbi:MAG: hypothetical protein MJ103_09220 [Saccharofermentans sp.]|nr:hypothetical protein [Saccharofermentans sp.]
MSENNYQDKAKIAKLPKDGVHCFPANAKQISTRRIVTAILAVVFLGLSLYFFLKKSPSLPLGGISAVVVIISALVFIQTFLIATYRVAVDYNNKEIVLRYKFSKIAIPFENFDARDGEPDKAEELINNSSLGGNEKTYYLVLDNVFDEACFQTSTKDLASREDFFKLKEEAFAIADAYGARNDENAIKPDAMKAAEEAASKQGDLDEDVIGSIVDEAKKEIADEKEEKKKEAAKKAEEAAAELAEALEEKEEA